MKGGGDISPTKSRSRNQTGINQDDVRTALQIVKPTPEINKIDIPSNKTTKTKENHEKDEGFEETQSLMSESPSQGTSSGI